VLGRLSTGAHAGPNSSALFPSLRPSADAPLCPSENRPSLFFWITVPLLAPLDRYHSPPPLFTLSRCISTSPPSLIIYLFLTRPLLLEPSFRVHIAKTRSIFLDLLCLFVLGTFFSSTVLRKQLNSRLTFFSFVLLIHNVKFHLL
jgi:hypothetical protein